MTFYIYWTDINPDKQQEMIRFMQESLLETAQEEGNEFLQRSEHKGETWYQAYASEYAIDWQYADDTGYDWEQAVKDYLETEAEKKLATHIRSLPIEVEEN